MKESAKIDIKGIGGKVISGLSNKGIKAIGDKIIDGQKEAIDKEIRDIMWGMVKCLMYKPGMVICDAIFCTILIYTPQEFQQCQDEFWGCLGFKVPFEFPVCSAMYKEADDQIAKFSSYREYLKHKKASADKTDNTSRAKCLEI